MEENAIGSTPKEADFLDFRQLLGSIGKPKEKARRGGMVAGGGGGCAWLGAGVGGGVAGMKGLFAGGLLTRWRQDEHGEVGMSSRGGVRVLVAGGASGDW